MRTIEQLMAAPSGKILQELRNLYLSLKNNGRTMEEFLEYMDGLNLQTKQREKELREEQEKHARICKKCGKKSMYCYPVNTGPRDQIGGNWKSQWICGNPDCAEEEESINDVKQEELEHLGG